MHKFFIDLLISINPSTISLKVSIIYALIVTLTASCNNQNNSVEVDESSTILSELPPVKVSVEKLERKQFYREIVSNGKLEGIQKSEMRFRAAELITRIYVKNGDWVKKGQLLARLDNFEKRNNLMQKQVAFENAKISLTDYLIGQGYDWSDSLKIPRDIMEIAKVKSGFQAAVHNLELAKFNLTQCELRATGSGLIANLKSKEKTFSKSNEPFCLIINNSKMEIRFPVMEPEAHLLKKGQTINIKPYYSNDEFLGEVVSVNPSIDENGLIEVRATISSTEGLLDGMNAKVYAKKSIGEKLAVPKQAITLRDQRPVVFVYKEGKAIWNYVNTEDENSTHVVIAGDDLEAGLDIIVDGNLHLAHESKVVLK